MFARQKREHHQKGMKLQEDAFLLARLLFFPGTVFFVFLLLACLLLLSVYPAFYIHKQST